MFCCAMSAARPGDHSPDCEKMSGSDCPNHKVIAHDRAGIDRWCDFCGKGADGSQVARGSGGWGSPSRISR